MRTYLTAVWCAGMHLTSQPPASSRAPRTLSATPPPPPPPPPAAPAVPAAVSAVSSALLAAWTSRAVSDSLSSPPEGKADLGSDA